MKSSDTHLISIIIPTFNRAQLIGETLDSVLAQTYIYWECIVVDDGSNDGTDILLNDYCIADNRIQYYKRPLNISKGANSCRNYGFEKSKGKYIKWLDSDDLLVPNALEETLNNFQCNIDVVISKLHFFDKSATESLRTNTIYSDNTIEDYLVGKLAYYICGPTWKRSFLEQQNYLFDEALSNLDDWDFNLRMLYQSPSIGYINKPLIKYRMHDNSLSKEINKLNSVEIKSEFKAREKHLHLLKKNRMAQPKVLKKFIEVRYKYLLRVALLQQSNLKYYLLKKTIIKQVALLNFLGCFKTLVGFVIYSTFKKGYRFIK